MLLQANSKGTQPEVKEIIKELRKKINELMEWQELMQEQRSRRAWLQEGDKKKINKNKKIKKKQKQKKQNSSTQSYTEIYK